MESVVERAIRLAQERGAFDDLPGRGKPLRGLDGPDDENWWIRGYLEREGLSGEALLPESLLLRREIERLPGEVAGLPDEAAVRAAVSLLNRRVVEYLRTPTPPRVPVAPIDPDAIVDGWRTARRDIRHPVEDGAVVSGTVEALAAPDQGAIPVTTLPGTTLSGTARAYRAVAIAEACSWAGLLIGMLFKYVVVGNDIGVKIFGPIHGALFVAYLVVTVVAARRLRWSLPVTLAALVASVPPLFTLWFERWAMRTGRLTGAGAPGDGVTGQPPLPSAS